MNISILITLLLILLLILKINKQVGDRNKLIKECNGLVKACEKFVNARDAIQTKPTELPPQGTSGADLIVRERWRQIAKEGYTTEHDDKEDKGELCMAAAAYLAVDHIRGLNGSEMAKASRTMVIADTSWPWDKGTLKPSDDPIRNLVKAGALIAAEIDRLQRIDAKNIQSTLLQGTRLEARREGKDHPSF